jgi:hypothetical protein
MNSHQDQVLRNSHGKQISNVALMLISGLLLSVTMHAAHAQTDLTNQPAATKQTPASAAAGQAATKHGPRGRAGRTFTPGWSLMTAEERQAHREHMEKITSYDECKSYLQQHHEKMAERAKEKGGKTLASPWRDACGAWKKK